MLKHLVLAAVGLASVLAPSATVAADGTLTCRGSTELMKPRGKDLAYSFGCNKVISSFSLITTQSLDYFNSRSELVKRSNGSPSEEGTAYECQGEIPGDGFSCVGGEQPRSTFASGDFGTVDRPCNGGRKSVLRAWVVVQHTEGVGEEAETMTSGPFPLKRAACPRPNTRRNS